MYVFFIVLDRTLLPVKCSFMITAFLHFKNFRQGYSTSSVHKEEDVAVAKSELKQRLKTLKFFVLYVSFRVRIHMKSRTMFACRPKYLNCI